MVRTKVRPKMQVTLPAEVAETLHIEEGDEIEFEPVDDGTVNIHGLKLVRTDQAWFWSPDWQAKEREADEDIRTGRTTVHANADDMFDHLEGR